VSYLAGIYRIRTGANFVFLRDILRKKPLEIGVSLLIILGIILGGYTLFLRGANFLLLQGEIGRLVLDRIFYLGWTIIFYLLILSNIITAFSTIYRSPEVSFLLTSPMSYKTLFRLKYLENALYSSWAILVLGLPLTLVYGRIKEIGAVEMLVVLLAGLLPYLFVATAVGLIIILIVAQISRWFQMRSIFLFLGVMFLGLFRLYFMTSQRGINLVGDLGNFRALDRYLFNLSQPPFPFIPSYWFSELFVNFTQGNILDVALFGGLLLFSALLGFELATLLAGRLYFSSFQIVEGTSIRRRPKPTDSTAFLKQLRQLTPQWRGLVFKDSLEFIRTPQQWVQFILFGFLIAVYLINLSRADIRFSTLKPMWQTMIYFFNFGFSGFFMVMLTSRFVYPIISLEGRAIWILRSAPLPLTHVFREKFWLAFFVFFPMAEAIALMSNLYLSQSYFISLLTTVFLLLTSLALISLALGLGAVFAQYHEPNPMKISSSAGGIITIILSLFYVGLMVNALIAIIYLTRQDPQYCLITLIVEGVVILNLVTILLPLRLGRKALLKLEI